MKTHHTDQSIKTHVIEVALEHSPMMTSPSHNIESCKVMGVRINHLDHEQIRARMSEWIRTPIHGRTVVFANTHVVMESRQSPALAEAVNAATLVVPDGMPLVIAVRSNGYPMRDRADGPGLMHKVLTHEDCRTWRHYFYGSTQDVLDGILQKFPNANIAGVHAPPFRALTPEEDATIVDEINASGTDVLWVGLGCPKQERWMFEHAARLNVPVILGVGQAFDILAGAKKRAPLWMCKTGLEWLYRLLQEPRRLWKRYLFHNTRFILLYLQERIVRVFQNNRSYKVTS